MKNKRLTIYYSSRFKLEKLKQKTAILIAVGRILPFLVHLVLDYIKRT